MITTLLILGGAGWSLRQRLYGQMQSTGLPNTSPKTNAYHLTVPAVKIEEVQEYASDYEYTGKVVPRRRSLLGFEVSGRIEKLVADEGDVIYQGQVLGRIEHDRFQNRLEQVLAQKEQAAANLKLLHSGRAEDISASQAQIRELEAELNKMDANLKRQQELFQKNVITREAYEQTYFSQIAVQEKINFAQQSLTKLQQGARAEEKQAQMALIKQLDETLRGISIDLHDCELKAPYSGIIVKRLHDEGEVLESGTPIFEMIEAADLEIRVGIPVKALKNLDRTEELDVLHARGVSKAKWRTLLAEIDPRTRTQMLILDIPIEQSSDYTAEDIVRVKVREKIQTKGFWVPTTALAEAGKGLWGCYVLKPTATPGTQQATIYQAENRLVETLHVEGTRTFVRGTLSSGEFIIAAGTLKIVPGQHVLAHLE
jgi:multidrug resistance efflux pump